MKKTNRLLCLIMALMMSVSLVVLSSCKTGGNGDSSGTPTGGEVTGNSEHGQEIFDYGGKTVMAACFYNGIVNKTGTSTSEAGIRTLKHMEYIQKLYNCKFDMVVSQSIDEQVRATHMANSTYADVLIQFASIVNQLRDEGLVYPIGDVYNLENPNTGFNWSAMEGGKKGGKYYYIFCGSPNVSVTTFKPKYLETYGIEDPYELYDQGKWTTDKYLEIVKKITQLGAADNVYGCTAVKDDPNFSQYLAQFGTEWIKKDEDGYFVSNLDDSRILEALNWVAEINTYAPPADAEGATTVFTTVRSNAGMEPLATKDPNLENTEYVIYHPLSEYISEPANVVYNANVTFMQSALGDEKARQIGAMWQSYTTYEGEWATSQEERDRLNRADWAARCYNDRSCDVILDLQKRNGGPQITNVTLAGNIHVNKDLFETVKKILAGETTAASGIESVKSYVESRIKLKNKELDK
ncbi:MAG: hypothetical protein J6K88_02725 [Oscillospiraceae bacterium]|nr:hypothetical protein [Oscillospiraceae bacterium]